jgi:hypothetical protein
MDRPTESRGTNVDLNLVDQVRNIVRSTEKGMRFETVVDELRGRGLVDPDEVTETVKEALLASGQFKVKQGGWLFVRTHVPARVRA